MSTTKSQTQALDKGWAWIIVLGGAVVNILFTGFTSSYPLVFEEMLTRFGESDFKTAFVMSILLGVNSFSAPLGSLLCNKFGHRKTAFASGLLTGMSFIISAFIPSVYMLYVSLGLLAGFGFGTVQLASSAMVLIYFEKRRGIAVALSSVTAGLGGAIFVPFVAWTLDTYRYPGMMLIFGGLVLNFCVVGALFRPFERKTVKNIKYNKKSNNDIKENNHNSCLPGEKHKLGLIHLNNPEQSANEKISSKQIKWSDNVSQFRQPAFMLLCLCVACMTYWLSQKSLFLLGFLTERHFSSQQVITILIIGSFTSVIGRLISGVLFDLEFVKSAMPIAFCLIGLLTYSSNILLTLFDGMAGIYTTYILLQFGLGMLSTQHSNVLCSIVGQKKITSSLGVMRFTGGIGLVCGPIIGGVLKDKTGTYMWGYFSSGCIGVLTTLCLLLQQILSRGNK